MSSGFASLQLRPLKLAFMVDPRDRKGILEAVQINTFLWGGTFNPIIPAFRRIPSRWADRESLTSNKLIEGYLDAFDPDYVVKVGKRTADVSPREVATIL
jgi:hypothetical protein